MKTLFVNQTMDHDESMREQDMRYKYIVKKVTNSITPVLNEELSPEELNAYCEAEYWDVTICND